MLNLTKFVKTEAGKAIMSILLGFGLATLFRTVCKGKNCIVEHACPLEDTETKVFKHDDKCYQYKPVSASCDTKKQIFNFE